MDELSRCHLILGVAPDASPETVKQAYRDLVKVWHPDRFGHDERLRLIAQEKLKEINGAYEFVRTHASEAARATSEDPSATPQNHSSEADNGAPSATKRFHKTIWSTLGVLGIASIVVAIIVFAQKKPDTKTPLTSHPYRDAPGTITTYALAFNRGQDHLTIATTGSLRGTFTIELWTKTRRPKATQTIVSARGPVDFGFNIKFRQGKRFHADIGDGSKWLVKDANATYGYHSGTWYHIAYVVTPTNYAAYVNGELMIDRSIYPPGDPMLYDEDHRLCFGMDQRGDTDELDGNIAEVRIWRTARTREEIVNDQNNRLRGDEPGLQGYWRFAHDEGHTTPDLSGHGFTGTLVNTAALSKDGPPITSR